MEMGMLWVVLNASSHAGRVEIPVGTLGWEDGRILRGLIDGQSLTVSGGKVAVHLPAWQGTWLG